MTTAVTIEVAAGRRNKHSSLTILCLPLISKFPPSTTI